MSIDPSAFEAELTDEDGPLFSVAFSAARWRSASQEILVARHRGLRQAGALLGERIQGAGGRPLASKLRNFLTG